MNIFITTATAVSVVVYLTTTPTSEHQTKQYFSSMSWEMTLFGIYVIILGIDYILLNSLITF